MNSVSDKILLTVGGLVALGGIYTAIIMFIALISDDDGFKLAHLFRPYAIMIEVLVIALIATGVHFLGKSKT